MPPCLLREHVNIAAGLQSSNPTEGLYIMLQPFGIDRNATNVQITREQISIGQIDRNFMQGIQQNSQQPRKLQRSNTSLSFYRQYFLIHLGKVRA